MITDIDGAVLMVGDLVRIVRGTPCCGHCHHMDWFVRIEHLGPFYAAIKTVTCWHCGSVNSCDLDVNFNGGGHRLVVSAKQVKLIPDLAALEEIVEEVAA